MALCKSNEFSDVKLKFIIKAHAAMLWSGYDSILQISQQIANDCQYRIQLFISLACHKANHAYNTASERVTFSGQATQQVIKT